MNIGQYAILQFYVRVYCILKEAKEGVLIIEKQVCTAPNYIEYCLDTWTVNLISELWSLS
jgi:hypothetical protein